MLGRYSKITDPGLLREYYREVLLNEFNRTLYPDVKVLEVVLERERVTNPAVARMRSI